MNSNLVGRDILNLRDLTPDQFRYLINLSWELKAQKKSGVDQRRFCGKNVVANFMRLRDVVQRSGHGLHVPHQLPYGLR